VTVAVNGVAVDITGYPTPEAAAVRELLRQRAAGLGLVDPGAGVEEIDAAIERLLEREVAAPEPTAEECGRYYQAHAAEFSSSELVMARHILFQVTPGAPVPALRAKAEMTLADLARDPSQFERFALECSNCPSAQHGGSLGQLGRGETVPEFEEALFNGTYIGIYPQLVRTRFGFHILAVDRRQPGQRVPLEAVRARIAELLRARAQQRALAQYVRALASEADIEGADLDAADTQQSAP
jgi:peptidyl-prolyl cis-trans isomerase C